ncbi:MAG: TolC family protein [Thermoanaerobaculia bacterium]
MAPASIFILSVSRLAYSQEPLTRESFVKTVLSGNPSASAARALSDEAMAVRSAARLVPDPVVELSLARARARDESGSFAGSGPSKSEIGGSIQQVIPWPGAFRAGIGVAAAESRGLEISGETLRWELEIDARQAFDELLFARDAVSVARDAESDARSLLDLTTRKVDVGESREVDRLKARVEWLKADRGLQTAVREERASETILRALVISPLPRPLVLSGELPMPAADQKVSSPSDLGLKDSLRYRAAVAEAERASAQLTSVRRSRMPDVGLTLFRNRELDREASGAAISLKVPLWNRNRGEIARAAARAALSTAEANRILLALTRDAERRFKDLELAVTLASISSAEIVSVAERSVALARLAYEHGETSLLDLLDAQRTHREARRDLLEARRAVAMALTEVERITGPSRPIWSSR